MCSFAATKSYSTKSLRIVENSSTKVRSSSSHRVYRKSRIFRCTRRWFQKRSSICFSVSSVIKALTMVLFIVISYAVVQVGFGKLISMRSRNSENSRTARLLTSFIVHSFRLLPAPSCKPCRSWDCPLRCAGTGFRCSFWSCGEGLRGWQNQRLR